MQTYCMHAFKKLLSVIDKYQKLGGRIRTEVWYNKLAETLEVGEVTAFAILFASALMEYQLDLPIDILLQEALRIMVKRNECKLAFLLVRIGNRAMLTGQKALVLTTGCCRFPPVPEETGQHMNVHWPCCPGSLLFLDQHRDSGRATGSIMGWKGRA